MNATWNVILTDERGGELTLTPQDMTSHTEEQNRQTWAGHPTLGENLNVVVETRQEGSLTVGTLSVSGNSHTIQEIHYPILQLDITPNLQILEAGADLGLLFQKPNLTPNTPCQLHLKGVPVVVLMDGEKNFYCDIRRRDRSAIAATYEVSQDQRSLTLRMIHCGRNDRPVTSAYGNFQGSWFKAAEIYRNWRWQGAPRLAEHPPFPKLRDVDLWLWNRGPAKDVITPLLELKQDLPDINLALNWYWWHHNPYDTDYPDFWPPREGIDYFREQVRILNQNNIYVQVYINGVCWDMDGETWQEGGEQDVIHKQDGSRMAVAFNQYNHHRLAYMCGEAPHFQKKITQLVNKLHDSGLDGQYLDMISNLGAYACYNPTHHHRPGDHQVFVEGYRSLLQTLKDENPDFALSSEGCSESFLDLLDSVNLCNTISQEHISGNPNVVPIPFFPAVYHGQCAYYGNYASPDGIPPWDVKWPDEDRWPPEQEQPWHILFPDQFYIEAMRNPIFGAQPSVCDYRMTTRHSPDFKEANDFIKHMALFYHQHKDYLFDGIMLSPEGFSCQKQLIRFHQRIIFTKPGKDKVAQRLCPAILHAVWQNPQGQQALFLGNVTNQPQPWAFRHLTGTLPPHTLEMRPL